MQSLMGNFPSDIRLQTLRSEAIFKSSCCTAQRGKRLSESTHFCLNRILWVIDTIVAMFKVHRCSLEPPCGDWGRQQSSVVEIGISKPSSALKKCWA